MGSIRALQQFQPDSGSGRRLASSTLALALLSVPAGPCGQSPSEPPTLAAGSLAQSGSPGFEARTQAPLVDLAELRAQPAAWIGQRVQCVAQLAPLSGPFESLETGFDPLHWRRFAFWSEGQRPWRAADFGAPAPYLFASVGSTPALLLEAAGEYSAVRLTCSVEAVCLGEPWVRIEAVEVLPQAIGAGAVLHASRAFDLLEQGQRRLAVAELERALAAPLPQAAQLELVAELEALKADLALRPEQGPPAPRPGYQGEIWHLELISPRTQQR